MKGTRQTPTHHGRAHTRRTYFAAFRPDETPPNEAPARATHRLPTRSSMPPTVISRAKADAGRGAPVESSSAAAIPDSSTDALEKVRQQARRLVEQQQQLQCALAYGKLCERRILQLQPDHALPLTAEHIKQQQEEPRPRPGLPPKPQPSGGGSETVPSSELDAMRERAELAEAALARARGRLPARRSPTRAANAGEPSTSGADGSSGSSGSSGRTATAEDQLQIASVEALREALRAAREETERQRKVAATAARESMKALEEAARTAGMPNGSAQVLRAHAASERTINELKARVAAVESADAALREQLRSAHADAQLAAGALKAEREGHQATMAKLADAEAAAREATKQMAAAASARTQHEVERAALLEAYEELEGTARRATSRAEQAESAAAEAATTRDRAVVTLMREEAAREAAEKEALY